MDDRLEANVVDMGVRKIIAGGGDADVDLARQVGERRVALAKVCDHVVQLCGATQHRLSTS